MFNLRYRWMLAGPLALLLSGCATMPSSLRTGYYSAATGLPLGPAAYVAEQPTGSPNVVSI
ncbi:hypothetical protein GCM10022409_45900 [Hymenobacter glaciei]|uniref:Uncharacterized protein n=1 Tax=Hymenobacter glaciei TaxID=877209 RepID=A0ABP7UVC3_9BACT